MKGGALIDPEDFLRAVERARLGGTYKASNMQMVSSMSSIFASFDLDKDGYIGKEELRVCLAVAGRAVREDILEEMIRVVDQDQDGRISQSEFCNFFEPHENIEISPTIAGALVSVPADPASRSLELISEAELLQMDSAGRRKKTGEIVLALLGGAESIKPKDIKQLYRKFTQLDTRKAGRLNMLQFSKIFDAYTFQGSRKIRSNYLNLLFAFCDADKSNYIDAKEFMTGLCWLGSFGNLDKLRFTFMLFDESGDGVLDRTEMTTFVASINIGSLTSKKELGIRVDNIFKKLASEEKFSDWTKFTLTFQHLIKVADENPDLFTSTIEDS